MRTLIWFIKYWVWQFPQILLGRFVIWLTKAVPEQYIHPETEKIYTVYYFDRNRNAFCRWLYKCCCECSVFDKARNRMVTFFSGTALIVIILPSGMSDRYYQLTVPHEDGHLIQGNRTGWLYLIVVGLPSVTWNLLARVFVIIALRYYKLYPEKQADRLGGVTGR